MRRISVALMWILAIVVALMSLTGLAVLSGLLNLTDLVATIRSDMILCIVTAFVLTFFCLCAIGAFLLLCLGSKPKMVAITMENDGVVRYTESAVKEMAYYTAKSVENVKDVAVSITVKNGELLSMELRCVLRTGTVLTETVTKMQEELRNYFQNVANIPLTNINVIITKTMD